MNPFNPSVSKIPKIKRADAKKQILNNIFDTYYGTTTFIMGSRGCGKTELMQTIKQAVLKHPQTTVIYLRNDDSLLDQLEQILSREIASTKINEKTLRFEIGVKKPQLNQLVTIMDKLQLVTIMDKLRGLTKYRHVIIEVDDVTNSAPIRTLGQIKGASNANDINFDLVMAGSPNMITDIMNDEELTFLLRSDKIYL